MIKTELKFNLKELDGSNREQIDSIIEKLKIAKTYL
jgi:hypothetical protein